ncbi:hypothetical protein ACQW02_11815 [Humitalea sp. 24SJ18S-53]|uniref:hypothetical protein n=1 Tax=Humitalea sp. 24SJ18S-53 TaxID=3422307 RepID=UPI003D672650
MIFREVLTAIGTLGLGALLCVMLIVSSETGYRLGRRRAARMGESDPSVGFIVTGMLGLLAFVLGLTLSLAQQRFEDRRAVSLEEANAIGTAWLRAGLPEAPEAMVLRRAVEDWADLRLAFVRAPQDPPLLDRINAETNRQQTEIWNQAVALARPQPNALSSLMLASLNDMFDQATAQRRAFNARIPAEILWMLLGMSVAANGAVGFHLGLGGKRHLPLSLLLMAMWAACMVSIADVNAARIGSVRPDDAPYVWTIQGFGRAP